MAKKGKLDALLPNLIVIFTVNFYLMSAYIFDGTSAFEKIQIKNVSSINESLATSASTASTRIESNNVQAVTAAALRSDYSGSFSKCAISEFKCDNNNCINANKFCNHVNDCGDSSDEPMHCTPCNRTYYGKWGLTYELEISRPKQRPFVCEMNFTAAGGLYGDIIQITLNGFSIGKFCSNVANGCPDGYLQISEASRSSIGGMWCGKLNDGPVVFFSETPTAILTLSLLSGSRNVDFDFRITYKVLQRREAVVRFGALRNQSVNDYYYSREDPRLQNNRTSLWSAFSSSSKARSFSASSHDDDSNRKKTIFDLRSELNKQTVTKDDSDEDNFQYENIRRTKHYNNKFVTTDPRSAWPAHPSKKLQNYNDDRVNQKYYLGNLISGTHCSRIFSDCDKKPCRLQSPNFPGIYPRNLTCYYAVRQHDVPAGKHAMIIVKQVKGDLLWIETQRNNKKNRNPKGFFVPQLVTWDECDSVQDYITVFDGYTTRDPVILKFCGGGGNGLPAAISSGPELLIEFVTSPYGTFSSSPVQSRTLFGFQLEVEVLFVDSQSNLYSKNKQLCEFWIRGSGHGLLESPRHSLPPNTTCLYHLQGTDTIYRPFDLFQSPRRTGIISPQVSRFKVWISVLRFDLTPKQNVLLEEIITVDRNAIASQADLMHNKGGGFGGNVHESNDECNGMLRIWDGPLREVPTCSDLNCERESKLVSKYGQNLTSVIARYCSGRIPKSCDHGVLNSSLARPCTVLESYVSSNDFVTLELRNIDSTVLQPVRFKLRYEFVDYQQDGEAITEDKKCDRKFISLDLQRREMGKFRSVRNIFLFGRGGATNLNCTYHFEADQDERIRITIKKLITSNRQCLSRIDEDTKRSYCFGDPQYKLLLMEQSSSNRTFFQRGCGCNSSNTSDLPIIYTSTGRVLQIRFTALNMSALDDPDHLSFDATYEFIKLPLLCNEVKTLYGTSGTVRTAEDNKECRTRQWVIEPSEDRFAYIRMNGAYLRKHESNSFVLTQSQSIRTSYNRECPTRARFILTNGDGLSITVCPFSVESRSRDFVEISSAGWDEYNTFGSTPKDRSLSVEYISPDDEQDYVFTWFEIQPKTSMGLVVEKCDYVCPELGACVNSTIWCDGIDHCPSGYDESFTHCSTLMKLPPEILASLSVCVILIICAAGAALYRKIKRKWFRGSSILQTRLKSMSSVDTSTFDDKDVIS